MSELKVGGVTPINEAISDRVEGYTGQRPSAGDTGFVSFAERSGGDAIFVSTLSHVNRVLVKHKTTSKTGVVKFKLLGVRGVYPVAVPVYKGFVGLASDRRAPVPVQVGIRVSSDDDAEVYWDLGSTDASSRTANGAEVQRCERATIWVLGVS